VRRVPTDTVGARRGGGTDEGSRRDVCSTSKGPTGPGYPLDFRFAGSPARGLVPWWTRIRGIMRVVVRGLDP